MRRQLVADVVFFVGSVGGALIVASNTGHQLLGFWLYLISNVAGAYLLLNSNASRSLLLTTMIFAAINVFGIIRA